MSGIRWAPGVLSVLPHLRHQVEGEMRLQEEAMRLAVLTPKGCEHIVAAERKHRQRLGMTEVDSYRSVGDDLVTARWIPEV